MKRAAISLCALPSILAEQSQFRAIPSFSGLSGGIPGSGRRSIQSGARYGRVTRPASAFRPMGRMRVSRHSFDQASFSWKGRRSCAAAAVARARPVLVEQSQVPAIRGNSRCSRELGLPAGGSLRLLCCDVRSVRANKNDRDGSLEAMVAPLRKDGMLHPKLNQSMD